ncbi:MAG: hypothetical protein M3275_00725 [Thermoproteota archaeon]|nr:hypothetical protein [Thermoproteota archaeon]MDQ3966901.1 hypothetical protein [Thermoproteota archaeon]
MVINPDHIEYSSHVRFKDAEGWDIVVVPGYAVFSWEANSDSLVNQLLEFDLYEFPDIGRFNDIGGLSVTAAPSSFGRFGPWGGTMWAVDHCRGTILAGVGVRVDVDLALYGKRAGLARVAFTLIIKGHLAP